MDELSRMDSPLHRLDARAKGLTTLIFLIAVMSFGRYEVSALMPLFVYPFALTAWGNLPAGFLLRKVALAAPFALFVGIFNPFLDRETLSWIGSHPVSGGWLSFASILLRFALTVSAGLILLACTGIHRLCAGAAQLGLPRVFVVQLLFLYRYFFVIGEEGLRMVRSVEMRGSRSLGLRTYGSLIGHLLLRSIDRAQRIYRAMISRGFDGEVRVLRADAPGWKDAAFVAGWSAFFIAARVCNLSELVGNVVFNIL
jgi:cobalt/nickel transport system permease protein